MFICAPTNGVAFTLVVDDFLIKFKQRSAAEHLLSALRELYTITTDFSAKQKYVRLIESKTGRFIHRHEMPADRTAAYYNPQLKIKHKADGIQYRVRGTIGGEQSTLPR